MSAITKRRRAIIESMVKTVRRFITPGTYANGTITVSQDNLFSVAGPANYSLTDFPINIPIDVTATDRIGIKFIPKPFATGTSRWYAVIQLPTSASFQVTLASTAPAGNTWYDATANRDGQLVAIRMETRTANLTGGFTVSVRKNSEVIL